MICAHCARVMDGSIQRCSNDGWCWPIGWEQQGTEINQRLNGCEEIVGKLSAELNAANNRAPAIRSTLLNVGQFLGELPRKTKWSRRLHHEVSEAINLLSTKETNG